MTTLPTFLTLHRKVGRADISSVEDITFLAGPGFEPVPDPTEPGGDLTVALFAKRKELLAFEAGFEHGCPGDDQTFVKESLRTRCGAVHLIIIHWGDSDDNALKIAVNALPKRFNSKPARKVPDKASS